MAFEAAKVMFEIYREAGGARYRAVYFTELDDHNKEAEIARAMAGEHLYDGFLADARLSDAKPVVAAILDRLNSGEPLDGEVVGGLLAPFEA